MENLSRFQCGSRRCRRRFSGPIEFRDDGFRRRSAAVLVDINVALGRLPGDLSERAASAVATAQAAAARVSAAAG